jgi:hypothetical protein
MRTWTAFLFVILGCAPSRASIPTASTTTFDDAGEYAGGISTIDASEGEDPGDDPVLSDPPIASDAGTDLDVIAAPEGAPLDAGTDGACSRSLGPGDLAIVELMIASLSGTGDHGEWFEVSSTLDCAINLRGLRGECPLGSKVATFDLTDDLWLPARGTFVVADSSDPAIDHDLPGTVVVWSGEPGDVLRNKGSTLTLRANGAIIDSVTYPALTLATGASIAFPFDCSPDTRSDWGEWQISASPWFPNFLGTPNAPNADVRCP